MAKPSTNSTILDDNEDFACNHVDCSPINEGGACHNPNTNNHHASYAMNAYYQRERHQWNCNFGDSGLLTFTNPSMHIFFLLYKISYILQLCFG